LQIEVSNVLRLGIGQTSFSVNGSVRSSDVAPQLIDGRTMVPLRLISEAMGARIEWDPDTETVSVYFD
jgi:hypothetical protein